MQKSPSHNDSPAGAQSTGRSPRHHQRGRRVRRVLGLALVIFATVGVAPAAADPIVLNFVLPELTPVRGEQVCEPGEEWADVPSSNWQPHVTHADRYEHFSGGPGSYSRTAAHQTTVTASFTATTEGTVKSNILFAALEAKVGFELKAEGSSTKSSSVTITENLTKNDVYIFFSGTIEYSGPYDYYRCSGNKPKLVNSGVVDSWQIESDGAVGCTQEVPSDTVAAKAKAQYCGEADTSDLSDVIDDVPSPIVVQWSRTQA